MNGRTAKALRKALGFHPADEREYRVTGATRHFLGHVTATGARRNYQTVKASRALTAAVLRAA